MEALQSEGLRLRAATRLRPARVLFALLGLYLAFEAVLAARFPIFFDEGLFVSEAQLLVDHATRQNAFLAVADSHGPLQRWLIAGLTRSGLPALAAGRAVSVAAGAATIIAVFAIARRISAPAAVCAAAVAVALPALVVHDAIAIADPLAVAAITVSVWLALRMAERPSLARGAAVGLAIAAALLTKRTGLLAVGLLPLSGLLFLPVRPLSGSFRRKWLAACALALTTAALGWFALSLAPPALTAIGSKYASQEYRGPGDVLRAFPSQLGPGFTHFAGDLLAYTTPLLLLAAALGIWTVDRTARKLLWLLLVWALVPLAVAILSARVAYPRYVLSAYPALAVLAGAGVAAVGSLRVSRRVPRAAMTVIALALLVPAMVFDVRVAVSPDSAHYPGIDDRQYVSGFAAGPVWPRLAQALRRASAGRGDRRVSVAFGGHGVGPIGLATQLGRPTLVEGSVNAGFFWARSHGHTYSFAPYAARPGADFVVAQDVDVRPPPLAVTRRYRPLVDIRRPHDGSRTILYERR